MKHEAIQLCLTMCELFGSELDRTTLWSRIDSALATASAKCEQGDIDGFISLCLDHIRADAGRAACHTDLLNLLQTLGVRDDAYRQSFVRYCGTRRLVILPLVKVRWEERKQMKANSRPVEAGEKGGAE